MHKRGLGRGLDALLPATDDGTDAVLNIELEKVFANPEQPRRDFDENAIAELADSIKEHGVVQPIVVRRFGPDYQVVVGERRLRASRLAGLATIPAIIKDLGDVQALEIALIENLQREDLNPVEEAEAYQKLNTEFGLSHEEIARRVGKSRPQVSNTLRLLDLQEDVRALVRLGKIAAGHARALLAVSSPSVQKATADRVIEQGLSVRETEAHVNTLLGRGSQVTTRRRASRRSSEVEAVENRLRDHLGTKVRITGSQNKGKLEIHYFSADDLERVVSALFRDDRAGDVSRETF